MNNFSLIKRLFILFIVCFLPLSYADELQIGGGVIATTLPAYIGAEEQNNYLLPFPYFYYKSDKLEIDRNVLTGFLWQNNDWYIDFSASGNIPVKSSETKARLGMDDLDWVGELGPALKYYFNGDPNSDEQLSLAFNVRKAYATDFSSIENVGWNYGLSLAYRNIITQVLKGELQLNSAIVTNFADEKYLNYYFGVNEQEQTQQRAMYRVKQGYQGSSINIGFTWKKDKLWLGSFLKYHMLSGTRQQNSPLVNNTNSWSFGLGLAWVFYEK